MLYKPWKNIKLKCKHIQGFSQASSGTPERNGRDNIVLSNRDSEKGVESIEDLKKQFVLYEGIAIAVPSSGKAFRV